MVARPALQRPVLVAAFRGWNDGGQGATLAAGYLARIWDAQRFADIDPESFVDFQANRPHVSLDEGLTRRIEWPENAFYHARVPGTERDVVLLLGVEPSLRWKTFCQLVVDLARDLEVELIVTLGSLLADVPHTRAAPVTGAASDPELVASLGLQHSRYEGPTGIVGVLQDACRREGLPAASLWAAVPHYVSLAPSPRAARALCDRLGQLLDIPIDTTELAEAEEEYVEQVTEAIQTDETGETAEYVAELEKRTDELDLEEHEDLPSGDSLAAELTRFLRERDADARTATTRPESSRTVSRCSSRRIGLRVEAVDDLVRLGQAAPRAPEPSTAAQRIPAALAAATPSGVSSKTSTSAGSIPAEPGQRHQVALRIGLRPRHVLRGDGEREVGNEAGGGEDAVEHMALAVVTIPTGTQRRGGGDRLSRGLRANRRAVAGRGEEARDALLDELRVALAEPHPHALLVGQAGELPEVLLARDRAAARGVELAVDLEPDRLVVRERAVEVEEDRPRRSRRGGERAAAAARPLRRRRSRPCRGCCRARRQARPRRARGRTPSGAIPPVTSRRRPGRSGRSAPR